MARAPEKLRKYATGQPGEAAAPPCEAGRRRPSDYPPIRYPLPSVRAVRPQTVFHQLGPGLLGRIGEREQVQIPGGDHRLLHQHVEIDDTAPVRTIEQHYRQAR